jgi:hypothetical protein
MRILTALFGKRKKASAPPPSGPDAPPGSRPPDERKPGSRLKGSADEAPAKSNRNRKKKRQGGETQAVPPAQGPHRAPED